MSANYRRQHSRPAQAHGRVQDARAIAGAPREHRGADSAHQGQRVAGEEDPTRRRHGPPIVSSPVLEAVDDGSDTWRSADAGETDGAAAPRTALRDDMDSRADPPPLDWLDLMMLAGIGVVSVAPICCAYRVAQRHLRRRCVEKSRTV